MKKYYEKFNLKSLLNVDRTIQEETLKKSIGDSNTISNTIDRNAQTSIKTGCNNILHNINNNPL